MDYNKLICRCGKHKEWELNWKYNDKWTLSLECKSCGAMHHLAQSDDYGLMVKDIVKK